MRRRALGLVRRFLRSILKDGIMQNLKDNGTTRQTVGPTNISFRPDSFASALLRNQIPDIGYAGGQNLVVPPLLLQRPAWADALVNFKGKGDQSLKDKSPSMKNPGISPALGDKPLCANYSDDGGFSLKDCLLSTVQPKVKGSDKVTVVGAGSVGIACGYTILAQQLTNQLCLVDARKDVMEGEVLDIQHGSTFASNLYVQSSTEYEATAGSAVCIVTAGVRQKEGESRLNLMTRNVDVMKSIIPPLVKHSPNTVLIIASNPVDIMTYISWKLSGLAKGRVFGSGTNLDSSRFRYYIAKRLGIAPSSCHGWIIGEHGDSSVAVWSGVNVAGVRLVDLNPCIGLPEDPENWTQIHREVIDSAGQVIKLKGYTSWAIGMSVAQLTKAVLRNIGSVHAVSVFMQGFHDIEEEVFMSAPAALGANGVTSVILQPLTDEEKSALHKSAKILHSTQQGINM